MFTSYDKAITALIMAVLSIISIWMGWGSVESAAEAVDHVQNAPDFANAVKPVIDAAESFLPPSVTSVISILTPILVWAIPNKR